MAKFTKLKKLSETNEFAERMKQEFLKRSPNIMQNNALAAALYMDNRFNFPGSTVVPIESQSEVQVRS